MSEKRNLDFQALLLLSVVLLVGSGTAYPQAANPPDKVVISGRQDRSVQVNFDHQLHVSYAACVECHHHTTGAAPSDPVCAACHRTGSAAANLSCAGCHGQGRSTSVQAGTHSPINQYHIDIPGLTGAFHLNCISCHEAIGTGPTTCGGCHAQRP